MLGRCSRYVPRSSFLSLALAGGCLLVAPVVSSQTYEAAGAEVNVTCPMTVGGSFAAKSSALSGTLVRDPAEAGQIGGQLSVDLTTLDTGIGLRNQHLIENYLETGRGEGYQQAVLRAIEVASTGASGKHSFKGQFTLHGVEQAVTGEATVETDGPRLKVHAAFPVHLPSHGIAKPRHLGIGVKDTVQVEVRLVLAEAGQP